MKKIVIVLFSVALCLTLKAQTIEELKQKVSILKQDNQRLKEKVSFCDLYSNSNQIESKSFSSKFDFKVLECRGNRIDQIVEIDILLKHNLPHQQMQLFTGSKAPVAYGETGEAFELKEAMFSQSKSKYGVEEFIIPTGVPIKGTLTFRNILPGTNKLSLITGIFEFENQDGGGNDGQGAFEIKNLAINWN